MTKNNKLTIVDETTLKGKFTPSEISRLCLILILLRFMDMRQDI